MYPWKLLRLWSSHHQNRKNHRKKTVKQSKLPTTLHRLKRLLLLSLRLTLLAEHPLQKSRKPMWKLLPLMMLPLPIRQARSLSSKMRIHQKSSKRATNLTNRRTKRQSILLRPSRCLKTKPLPTQNLPQRLLRMLLQLISTIFLLLSMQNLRLLRRMLPQPLKSPQQRLRLSLHPKKTTPLLFKKLAKEREIHPNLKQKQEMTPSPKKLPQTTRTSLPKNHHLLRTPLLNQRKPITARLQRLMKGTLPKQNLSRKPQKRQLKEMSSWGRQERRS